MNAGANIEPRWKTYSHAVVFLVPALFLWGFSCVFLFPKLQQICRDAGMQPSTAQSTTILLKDHFILICFSIVFGLFLLEWRSSQWPNYRRFAVGMAVFLLNAAVLVLMTSMLASALIAAPALARIE